MQELQIGERMNVYMDHAATTPLDSRVVEAMEPFYSIKYGNPSSRSITSRA